MAFNLDDYEPVEDRIKRFYKDNPEGRILTDIVSDDGTRIIIKASLYKGIKLSTGSTEDSVWTTGLAEEVRGEGFVNKTSAVENCETSAVGRALANANYAGSKRASREEMEKVERQTKEQPDPKADFLTSEQVAKLVSLAKHKGAETKDEAIKFINGALLTKDFTKLEQSEFDGAKAVLSDPKVTYSTVDTEPF